MRLFIHGSLGYMDMDMDMNNEWMIVCLFVCW